jgi:hypothetical protein
MTDVPGAAMPARCVYDANPETEKGDRWECVGIGANVRQTWNETGMRKEELTIEHR